MCVGSKGSRDLEAGGVHVLCLMEGECVRVVRICGKGDKRSQAAGPLNKLINQLIDV